MQYNYTLQCLHKQLLLTASLLKKIQEHHPVLFSLVVGAFYHVGLPDRDPWSGDGDVTLAIGYDINLRNRCLPLSRSSE